MRPARARAAPPWPVCGASGDRVKAQNHLNSNKIKHKHTPKSIPFGDTPVHRWYATTYDDTLHYLPQSTFRNDRI
jgi:hypothetical protein